MGERNRRGYPQKIHRNDSQPLRHLINIHEGFTKPTAIANARAPRRYANFPQKIHKVANKPPCRSDFFL
jgi:hypothetical protein